MLFLPAVVPPPTLSSNAWWFLGTLDGTPCYSGELAEEVEPEDTSFRALRPLLRFPPSSGKAQFDRFRC